MNNSNNDILFENSVKNSFLIELQKFIAQAKKLNLVVEITLEPQQPLAQGNYEMVPHIRYANKSKQTFIPREEVVEIKNVLKTMKRQVVLANWLNDTIMLCEKIGGDVSPIGVITKEVYELEFGNITQESLQDVNPIDKSESS